MAPLSLGALCRKTVVANIDELTYVGDLPYDKVKDLLTLVRNDGQLQEIEQLSPQIQNEDDGLWAAFARKKFLPQLKKMKKLNNDQDVVPLSWRRMYWDLRKEDDAREAQALAHLEKTFTNLNNKKDQQKANLADPRRLPKRPRDAMGPSTFSHHPDRFFSSNRQPETAVQKVRREADRVVANRQLAIKKRMTPMKPLSTVPKGLPETMRMREKPRIPMRSDKLATNKDAERREREYEERRKREEKLLAAQRPKAPVRKDSVQKPGANISGGLQAVLNSQKLASAGGSSSRPKPASAPKTAPQPMKKTTNSLFSCPSNLQKAPSRTKFVTSNAPVLSTIDTRNGPKTRPSSSSGLSGAASSPSAMSITGTESEDDDLFGDKQTITKKQMGSSPKSPTKRPISLITGSSDDSNTMTPNPSISQLPRKKQKTTGIFMPKKRAR